MSEYAGEKTEQATPKRLEEAISKGQFGRSREVQTVFVLMGGLAGFMFYGGEIWRLMTSSSVSMFSHLHDTPVTLSTMQGYAINAALVVANCVWPIAVGTIIGGLLAGAIQSRFRASPEALSVNWQRLNPMEGFKRI